MIVKRDTSKPNNAEWRKKKKMGRDIEGNTMKMKARIILATQDQVEVEGKNPKLRKKKWTQGEVGK